MNKKDILYTFIKTIEKKQLLTKFIKNIFDLGIYFRFPKKSSSPQSTEYNDCTTET